MPTITTISQKFLNQFHNGEDFSLNPSKFTTNLVGCVGEKVRAVVDVSIAWQEDVGNDIYGSSEPRLGWDIAATYIYTRLGFDGSLQVGDTFDFIDDFVAAPSTSSFNATVTAVSTNQIDFTVNSGTVPVGSSTTAAMKATAADNPLYALDWWFGLLENGESWNNSSKVTNWPQTYQTGGIGLGSPRSTSPVSVPSLGANKDWVTGEMTASYQASGLYTQTFQIIHDFIIVPFSQSKSDFDNAEIPVSVVNGLKYAFEFRFAETPTSSRKFSSTQSTNQGQVNWYNESIQSGGYLLLDVSYEDTDTSDSVLGIQDAERTTATITLSKSGGFSAGQRAGLMVSMIQENDSDYKNTATDLPTNFLFDTVYHNEGDATTTTSGIIKSMSSSIDGSSNLVIVAEIEYTLQQGQKASGKPFLLSVLVADESIAIDSSDKINILADTDSFAGVNVIPKLATFGTMGFFQHADTYTEGGGVSAITESWPEDGILIEIPFALDLSRQAFLNRFLVKLSARDTVTGNVFELDTFAFNTGSAVVSGGVQQINMSSLRGYDLPVFDKFNKAEIATKAKVGDIQNYLCIIGQKLTWQDWIQNLAADTVFYDVAKPNDNLNDKSSNYSNLNNYEIVIEAVADVSGVNELGESVRGLSEGYSGNISVFDYTKDGNEPPIWSCVIETRDPDTNADLGGNILSHKNTLFRAVWTNTGGAVISVANLYAIHRIEIYQDKSFGIEESSTNQNNINELLSDVTVSLEGSNLVTSCLIYNTNLDLEASYSLSARLQK